MTIADPVFALLSMIVLCMAMATQPSEARCPAGWYLEGVQRDGRYHCRPRSLLPDLASRGHEQDEPDDPATDHELHGRIYCTGGTRPILVNERIAGCQRE